MLTLHVKKASTLWQSTVGLIGAQNPYPLLLHTRFGIHTFGVRFPLDILILNDQYKVMRLKKSLVPNRIFLWLPIWAIVLELPSGTIARHHIRVGDTLSLILSSRT